MILLHSNFLKTSSFSDVRESEERAKMGNFTYITSIYLLNILKQLCKNIVFFFPVVVKVLPQTNDKPLDLMCFPYCISSLNTNWTHHFLTAWMELHLLTCNILLNLFLEGLIGNAIHQGVFTLSSKLQKLHFVLNHEAILSYCLGWLSSDRFPGFFFYFFNLHCLFFS